jgi:benzoate membrane transport protein
MSFLGLGAAFWGLIFGIATHLILKWRPWNARQPQS